MEIRDGYIKEAEMTSPIDEEEVKYVFNKEYKIAKKKQLVFNNELIGEVTKSGEYFISDAFLSTLVEVNKEIVDAGDNHYQAIAKSERYPDFFLKFSISIEGDYLNDKKTAKLTFLETIKEPISGLTTIVKTLVATYEDDNDAYFFAKVKSIFHLYEKDEGEGKDIANDLLIEQIIIKRNLKRDIKKFQQEKIMAESERYCVDMLAILKKSGKFGEFVLKKLQELMAEMGIKAPQKGELDYYKKLAAFIDKALQQSENFPIPKSIQTQIDALQNDRTKQIDATIAIKELPAGKKETVKAPSNESNGPSKSGSSGKSGSKGTSASSGAAKTTVSKVPKWVEPPHSSNGNDDAYDITKGLLGKVSVELENDISNKNMGKSLGQ